MDDDHLAATVCALAVIGVGSDGAARMAYNGAIRLNAIVAT
jgi:hypothetical protein